MDSIISDAKTLGLQFSRLTHTSDYFQQLVDVAERLIKEGILYADDTPTEQMRQASSLGNSHTSFFHTLSLVWSRRSV